MPSEESESDSKLLSVGQQTVGPARQRVWLDIEFCLLAHETTSEGIELGLRRSTMQGTFGVLLKFTHMEEPRYYGGQLRGPDTMRLLEPGSGPMRGSYLLNAPDWAYRIQPGDAFTIDVPPRQVGFGWVRGIKTETLTAKTDA